MRTLTALIFTFYTLFVMTGCGYMPASKQARKVVGDKIFVEIELSLKDPENSVLIKDATRKAIVTRFHSSLVPRAKAKTVLLIKLSRISFSALQYDSNGYVIVYRANVSIVVTRKNGTKVMKYSAKGTHDFAIEPNAVITDSQRFDAIRNASLKALDSFVAQMGAEGSRL